ncbi:MAG: phospholipid N-methyltransferase [Halioglobus sp.]|jgi:phospholipid N-methyltransferase
MSRFKFLLQAIKNFREVGTVTRSGKAISEKITSFISKEDKYILELGSGDGAITKRILDRMHPNGKLLAFEINSYMYENLSKIKDPRFFPINDSAENMEKYMSEHEIEVFDSIVSALPYLVLPEELAKSILGLCKKNLKKGKSYMQLHYAKTLTSLYEGVFGNLETHFVFLNVPPGYAFRCIKE